MTHPRYSPYCLVDFYAVFLKKAFFSGEQRAWEERKAYGIATYRTFEARRTAYVFYTRTADENILIRRNIQQIEPLNDGANLSSFSLVESPPRDLKITAYK